jgi:hypothetical protein
MGVILSNLPQVQFSALLIILSIIITRLIRNKFSHGINNIPGPSIAAYTDIWRAFKTWKGDMEQTQLQLHKKYGPVIRVGPNSVSISDIGAVSTIYRFSNRFNKVFFSRDLSSVPG